VNSQNSKKVFLNNNTWRLERERGTERKGKRKTRVGVRVKERER